MSSATSFYISTSSFHPELVGPDTPYPSKIEWLEDTATKVGLQVNAGLYCYDCNQTLCSDGPTAIHSGRPSWFDHCPGCGTEAPKHPEIAEETIRQAKSFFWQIALSELKDLVGKSKIEDSDGREYTLKELLTHVSKRCQFEFNTDGELIAG